MCGHRQKGGGEIISQYSQPWFYLNKVVLSVVHGGCAMDVHPNSEVGD